MRFAKVKTFDGSYVKAFSTQQDCEYVSIPIKAVYREPVMNEPSSKLGRCNAVYGLFVESSIKTHIEPGAGRPSSENKSRADRPFPSCRNVTTVDETRLRLQISGALALTHGIISPRAEIRKIIPLLPVSRTSALSSSWLMISTARTPLLNQSSGALTRSREKSWAEQAIELASSADANSTRLKCVEMVCLPPASLVRSLLPAI
ncbi:MAG: hypothetical protein JWO13_3032 [Acidobacteriales bacterium]|nr:hypothetical protein [Terriglobales bacterium]